MNSCKNSSSTRVLFLLNLLCSNELSTDEILEEFKKNNIPIKRTSIINYINKLEADDIKIDIKKNKKKNCYFYSNNKPVELEPCEIDSANSLKKLLLAQKDKDIIKKTIRIFYKFALNCADKDTIYELINFDYYSKLNWSLIKQLKYHCKNKNIIELDYFLPEGEHKYITIHTDMIKMGDWSNRLYLSGILKNDNKISQLPIDKIFMIKKVIKEKVRINLNVKTLTYKVSEEMFNKIGLDKKEIVSEIKDNTVAIKRPLDDTFFTLQRLLYFCPDLYYVSDDRMKNMIKEKLNSLKDIYYDDINK